MISDFTITGTAGSWRQTAVRLAVLVGLLFFGVGCNRQKLPDYDRLQFQVLRDYFTVSADDPVQAEKQLNKLDDLSPGQPLVPIGRRQEKLRQTMITLNRLARERRLTDARGFITTMKAQLGPVPELLYAEMVFAALDTVETYRQLQPFSRSRDVEKALEPVLRQRAILDQSPAFPAWLKAQDTEIRRLQAQELAQEFRRKLQEYDRLLISGQTGAGNLLQDMKKLNVPGPEVTLAMQWLTGQTKEIPVLLEAATADASSIRHIAAEIGLCQEWPNLTKPQQEAVAVRWEKADPVSMHGKLLQIRILFLRNRLAEAIGRSQELARQTALPQALVSSGLTAFVLPKEQYLARSWRTPYPSFTDLLLRLEQIRDAP